MKHTQGKVTKSATKQRIRENQRSPKVEFSLRQISPLTDRQHDMMSGITNNNHIIGYGSAGTGKAQPLTSKVLTPSGWKFMGDVVVGDVVVGQRQLEIEPWIVGRRVLIGNLRLPVVDHAVDRSESARRLQTQMVATFPQLKSVPITHSWTGQLGLTFDLMPHIGRVNGVHYAFGYGGHGVSIATYLGTEMGKLLCGEKTSSPFAEIKHQTMPFYHGRPWFIPFAAMYYRFLDRIM